MGFYVRFSSLVFLHFAPSIVAELVDILHDIENAIQFYGFTHNQVPFSQNDALKDLDQ